MSNANDFRPIGVSAKVTPTNNSTNFLQYE